MIGDQGRFRYIRIERVLWKWDPDQDPKKHPPSEVLTSGEWRDLEAGEILPSWEALRKEVEYLKERGELRLDAIDERLS